jgi:hypothetical protein
MSEKYNTLKQESLFHSKYVEDIILFNAKN